MTIDEYYDLYDAYRASEAMSDCFWDEAIIANLEETLSWVSSPDVSSCSEPNLQRKYLTYQLGEDSWQRSICHIILEAIEIAKKRRDYWADEAKFLKEELESEAAMEALRKEFPPDEDPSYFHAKVCGNF